MAAYAPPLTRPVPHAGRPIGTGPLVVCLLAALAPAIRAQTASIDLLATVPGPVTVVHADAPLAVLASNDTLRVLDLSVPGNPTLRGTLTLTDQIWDVALSADRAYVANGFVGLVVVDLRDPDAPAVQGSYEVVSRGQTVSVAMAGELVLTTNNQTGLNAFDVSDPAAPRLLSSWLTGGYSRDVAGMGHLGLVADQPDGLHVIDLTDPTDPLEAAVHFADGETTQLVTASSAAATAFIVDAATSIVEIVDLATPEAAARVGAYQAPGRISHLAVDDTTLFLTLARQGLAVVDVSDPAAPALIATYDSPGDARGVALAGDVILVADGEALLVLQAPR